MKLGWAKCDAAATRHGASFYLADLTYFEENCRRFLAAFRAIYPNTNIGYSYKTNYLPQFIRSADALGAYAEVVSRFEFDLAAELGIPGNRVIFNGPVKRSADLIQAFAVGARVNADSITELKQIIEIAGSLRQPTSVGIRCYLGEDAPGSRFGIDLSTPEAAEVLAALASTSTLRLTGLHCHHSGSRSAERYRARMRAMIQLHAHAVSGCALDYIDIGGGFASGMSPALAAQLAGSVASFDDYAEAVAGEMRRAYGEAGPELILEPGMAVLADTMAFVTRVETLKSLGGRRLAVVDGSVFNIKPLRGSINLPVTVIPAEHDNQRSPGPWDIVGHTCMEVDTLHTGYDGPIGIGDYIVVENVGAYTNVLNSAFIRGTPAVLELDGDQPGAVLRRESTVRDLLGTYEDAQ